MATGALLVFFHLSEDDVVEVHAGLGLEVAVTFLHPWAGNNPGQLVSSTTTATPPSAAQH